MFIKNKVGFYLKKNKLLAVFRFISSTVKIRNTCVSLTKSGLSCKNKATQDSSKCWAHSVDLKKRVEINKGLIFSCLGKTLKKLNCKNIVKDSCYCNKHITQGINTNRYEGDFEFNREMFIKLYGYFDLNDYLNIFLKNIIIKNINNRFKKKKLKYKFKDIKSEILYKVNTNKFRFIVLKMFLDFHVKAKTVPIDIKDVSMDICSCSEEHYSNDTKFNMLYLDRLSKYDYIKYLYYYYKIYGAELEGYIVNDILIKFFELGWRPDMIFPLEALVVFVLFTEITRNKLGISKAK